MSTASIARRICDFEIREEIIDRQFPAGGFLAYLVIHLDDDEPLRPAKRPVQRSEPDLPMEETTSPATGAFYFPSLFPTLRKGHHHESD